MSEESRQRSVVITVDLDAICHNVSVARALANVSSHADAETGAQKLFAVVKADAYGHGSVQVAQAVQALVDGFAVVTLSEAIALRNNGIHLPILVLQGPQQQQDLELFLQHTLWPVIHDHQQVNWFKQSPKPEQRLLNAWIKIDTGMGRLGFQPAELGDILESTPALKWIGVMSHLACADEPSGEHTQMQIDIFNSLQVPAGLDRSLANSAATLIWPEAATDWARPGIMLYGSSPLSAPHAVADLKAAMTVTAPLVSRKRITAGSTIGYAATYKCERDMDVGWLAIGYADGLPRVLEDADVLLNDQRCSVLGRVSMDSIAIDLSNVPAATIGDRAQIWGPEHPAKRVAAAAGTITYELFTGIRGKRNYIGG